MPFLLIFLTNFSYIPQPKPIEMKSSISMISSILDGWSKTIRVVLLISHSGQLLLALFILLGLFLFYEFFIQQELAKLLEGLDFRPPQYSPH